jgi:serine/threonine-protein kinase
VTSTTLVAGRYRLERRLGLGGMSTVHLAFDERLERYVAVKLLAEHLAEDPAFVSRFRREALAAARLVHPNIVQVFDFGFDEHSGHHFIVMEHVAGQSCAELLRDRGHLDPEETVDIVTQACRGLDYAHRGGVVHRDVKPGNLLRANDGGVKLADFGIAKATEQSSITQVGSVLGTAAYLAPEQARGEEAGPGSDLYSLGVVTYQLLSGRLPYEATSLSELALKQQREAPAPLEVVNPDVPPTLARAVFLALSLDAHGRPADAIALEQALRDGLEGREPAVPTGAPAGGEETGATAILSGGDDATAVTRRAERRPPREPRADVTVQPRRRDARPPDPRRGPRVAPDPRGKRRGGRRHALRRTLAFLAILLLIAAGAGVAIIATTSANQAVKIEHTVVHKFEDAYNQLRQLIRDNTR